MPRRRAAATVLAALLLTACGSTVQQTSEVALDGTAVAADGLGPDAAPAPADTTTPPDGGAVPGQVGSEAAPGVGVVGQGPESVAGTPGAPRPAAPRASGPGGGARRAPGAARPVATGSGPVTVGFFVTQDLGPATKALGVDGLATGDGKKHVEAAVELVNAAGGIGGRPIRPVVFEFDVNGNAETQYQAACARFFEDNKAQAVVSILQAEVLSRCVEQRGAVLVSSSNRAPSRALLARFPHTVVPSQLPVEDVVAVQVQALARQRWFAPVDPAEQVKVGLLYADVPDFRGVPAQAAKALRAAGLTLSLAQEMPAVGDSSDVAAASSAGSNAVLRFRGAGINRVLVVDQSGQAIAYFGLAAQNQGYFPRYGISSLELPVLLRTVLSARQLEGASGIGFAPLYDVPVRAQPTPNANVKACVAAMDAAGEDMASAATRAFALTVCDGALLLAAAGDVARPAFLDGLRRLGRGFPPVMTPSVDFSRGRAPVDAVRDLRFSAQCDCFQYSGAVQRVS